MYATQYQLCCIREKVLHEKKGENNMGSPIRTLYSPRVADNGCVTYKNSKGQDTHAKFAKEKLFLPRALNQAIKEKQNGNLTKSELNKAVLDNLTGPLYWHHHAEETSHCIERYEFLRDHYSETSTEGEGKDIITQKEQFEMMEYWDKWYDVNRK